MERLFREEALKDQRSAWLGTVNLATPLSATWCALLAGALAAAAVSLLIFGHYTHRAHVSGQLLPSAGLLTLSATMSGVVSRTLVREGDTVIEKQALAEISADLVSTSLGDTRALVSTQLRSQQAQLRTTLRDLQSQADATATDLRARIAMLLAQVQEIDGQLVLQRKLASAATLLVDKVRPLVNRGLVSQVQYNQHEANALAQQAQVKILARQRLDTEQQLSVLRSQLKQLPLDTAVKNNELRRQIAQLASQLAENEAQRSTVLRAPCEGTIATLLAKPGQAVVLNQPLLSILPRESRLEAQLLVPSSAMGFIAPGNRVVLRYQAYPYQKFGQQYGRVSQISRSALSREETASLAGQNTTEPVYRVLVALDSQKIAAYGKTEELKPGMALEADIVLDRRSLWQWIFEPMYGMRQQMMIDQGDRR